MCNLYTYRLSRDEIAGLLRQYKLIGKDWAEAMRIRNESTDVYPNRMGPVVVVRDGQRLIEEMRWGFTPWGKGTWLTNFREPERRTWKPLIADKAQRCVVPASAFSEPDRNTAKPVQWRWFARADGQPFFFAGVWTRWHGDRGTKKEPNVGEHQLYSIMTTAPNGIVQPIHDKAMPVMLMTPEDVDRWLNGTAAEALELQKPAPDDAVVVIERKKAA